MHPSDESRASANQQKAFDAVRKEFLSWRHAIDPNGDGVVSREEMPSPADRDALAKQIADLKDLSSETARDFGLTRARDEALDLPPYMQPLERERALKRIEEKGDLYAAALQSEKMKPVLQNLPNVELDDYVHHDPHRFESPIPVYDSLIRQPNQQKRPSRT